MNFKTKVPMLNIKTNSNNEFQNKSSNYEFEGKDRMI